MWKRFFLIGLLAGPLFAQAKPVILDSGPGNRAQLLEIFTSQGCSSCPPAEHWANQLQDDPELWKKVVPVVYHVDYWDYLGWKDPFADKRFSKRQRAYRSHERIDSVYTPGFVLNGLEWRGWFQRKPLPEPRSDNSKTRLSATIDGNQVEVLVGGGDRDFTVHAALLGFDFKTSVTRGENRGRQLAGDFVAIETIEATVQSGKASFALKRKTDPNRKYAIAIWLTHADPLKPISATGGWL